MQKKFQIGKNKINRFIKKTRNSEVRRNIRKINYKKRQLKPLPKLIFILFIILIIAAIIFCISSKQKNNKNSNNMAKNFKIGNNTTSQEIVDHILNISSYEAEIEVEVKSNKNSNKYKIKQTYINSENSTQEVLEPDNIKGIKITRENNKLKIENTKLNLTKITENYKELTQNNLDLSSFIDNYKSNKNSKYSEENNQIIMETTAKSDNNYQKYEKLYVSKESGKPTKMEIKDTNQNTIIYIIYNEININKTANNTNYAFSLLESRKEI